MPSRVNANVLFTLAMIIFVFAGIAHGDSNPGAKHDEIITSVPRTMTYQGILKDNAGDPLPDSVYNVTFRIFDVESGGSSLWDETLPCTTSAGLFNTTFSNVNIPFDVDCWLELEVDLEILTPRQKINMTAYAARADTADYAFAAPGGGDFWSLTGNSGTVDTLNYLGTSDSTALEFRVFDYRALRVEPVRYYSNLGSNLIANPEYNSIGLNPGGDAPFGVTVLGGGFDNINFSQGYFSVIGGGGRNVDSSWGYSTIGGGQYNKTSGTGYATIGGGDHNTVTGVWSTISGGAQNTAAGSFTTVAGGGLNSVSGDACIIGGGEENNVTGGWASFIGAGYLNAINSSSQSSIAGGYNNTVSASYSFIGSGRSNSVSGQYSTIPGGHSNAAAGDYSFAAGRRAKANHNGAFVWADQTNADFASTAADQFLIRASGGVGIGTTSPGYKLDVQGTVGIDVGSNFADVPLTLSVPSNHSGLISRISKGGSLINVVDGNGNVGIGTFSPAAKLDVNGTARMTGFEMPTGASSGYVLTSDGSGTGTWQAASPAINASSEPIDRIEARVTELAEIIETQSEMIAQLESRIAELETEK